MTIDDEVQALTARYHRDLETMCEIALTRGACGVKVTWRGTGYTIEIDPQVPYGEVWEQR